MDRFAAIVFCLIVLGAILAGVIYWNRRLHAARQIDGLLEEYFQGKMPVGQLGQRARALASQAFFGGSTFFALAVSAFQHAIDVTRAKQASLRDEDELMRRLADLKREFGVTERYKFEGRPGRE